MLLNFHDILSEVIKWSRDELIGPLGTSHVRCIHCNSLDFKRVHVKTVILIMLAVF